MRFFKDIVLALALLAFACGTCIAGDPAFKINVEVKEFRLDNGMLFLVVERPTVPEVACRVAIRAGSALENAGSTGVAHMLEHMMFKGTKNFGTLDVKKDLELQERIEAAYQVILAEERRRSPDPALIRSKRAEMERLRLEVQKIFVPNAFSSQVCKNGAVGVNAFTSKDQTQYTMSVPSDMLEQWFSIVSEQLFEPSWREFYVEKEVVQREWAFRYINSPQGASWLDLNATAYTAHPYRNPTIGWKSDMEKYSTMKARKFHGRYYTPTNAVCVLVGHVTVEEAKRLAGIYFARYPGGKPATEEVTGEPPQSGPRKRIRFLKGARTPLVRIGFHAARMGSDDFFALDAMTMVLTGGRSARMTKDIINKGLAMRAWAHNPDNRYGGMVILGGSPNEPPQPPDIGLNDEERAEAYIEACERFEEILLNEIRKLRDKPVSRREIERIKRLGRREFMDRMRSNEDLASSLATFEVQVGWRYLKSYPDRMEEVTPEDIMRVAKKYLRVEDRTSVYVIPGGKPEHPPARYSEVRSVQGSTGARLIATDMLTNNSIYPTPVGWRHPLSFVRIPEKIEYPKAETVYVKGATVFYLPDKEFPLVDLMILVKAGAVDLPESYIGLSGLINGCIIRGGTERHTPSELAAVLDENAIRLSFLVGEEETVIRLSVMKEDWDKGLELLSDVLVRPGFDSDVFEIVKKENLTALGRQGGNARSVLMREANIRHFKGHPYGRDPLRGIETIPGISRDDLKDFLKKYVVCSNMVAAVSGDIEKAEVVKGLESLFRTLPDSVPPQRELEDPVRTPPILALIHKPGQVQSQVGMYMPGIKRTDPDYWKLDLLMNIFGGGDSLLYTRLRDDLGLIYAAWFYQTFKWRAGMLVGYIGCKGDKTGQAILETVEIMRALQGNVPEKEMERKRMDVLNSFVFNVDTPTELAEVYARYHLRGEPLDTLGRIQDAYIGADRRSLGRLAEKFLDPGRLQVFVVGDKTAVVKKQGGLEVTLEQDLISLAKSLGLPYREIKLR